MKSTVLAKSIIEDARSKLGKKALIHVFGLGFNVLKETYRLIDSFDTSAWIYWAKMDGACFVWESEKTRFIQLQARSGHKYETSSLMRLNLK
jgi:hypothetical protein